MCWTYGIPSVFVLSGEWQKHAEVQDKMEAEERTTVYS